MYIIDKKYTTMKYTKIEFYNIHSIDMNKNNKVFNFNVSHL